MALQSLACEKCGKVSDVDVPDDGTGTVWECTDHECLGRNVIEGVNPAPDALASADGSDVVQVSDSDDAVAGDQRQ